MICPHWITKASARILVNILGVLQGNAAIYILRSAFGVNWSERIRIIYAGDDLTDEDAMQALKVHVHETRHSSFTKLGTEVSRN